MRPPLKLELPKRRSWPWPAVVASIVVHCILLFGWVGGRLPVVPQFPSQLIVLSPPSQGPDEVSMRYRFPEAADRRDRELAESRPVVRGRPPIRPEPRNRLRAVPALPAPSPGVDTSGVARRQLRSPLGRIGPGLAQGRLWVRPLPLPPRELAQRLSRSRAELVDSAVTAIVQAYLDSIANDPATRNQGLPSWTTEVAGKKFGLDSKNIYIAGLKIPAAVLALLPIPAGNIDQNRAYNHLMDLRADLLYAAQRAQTMEEFKTIVREMRERKEREREFERNQRTAPPPEEPPVP